MRTAAFTSVTSWRKLTVLTLTIALCMLLVIVGIRMTAVPATDRDWAPPQRVLPRVVFHEDRVEIRNVRDFTWRSDSDFDRHYTDRTYHLHELDSVWYVVSRFGGVPGVAHSFLTFGFSDEYLSISVEARKESSETYSPLRGLLARYELMYVIGTERDVIGLRTNVWKEQVTLYPIRTEPETLRRVFLEMTARAEKLAVEPELYDTVTNSCSSNIVRHVNAITPGRVRFGLRTILPGHSDRLAYELGMVDSTLPFEQARERFRIDAEAQRSALDRNFSRAIRQHLPRG